MDKMTLDEFVEHFCDELNDTDINTIDASTEFKKINEWDSLVALSIIAMIDEEFEVRFTGNDMINSITIEDLYKLAISRL